MAEQRYPVEEVRGALAEALDRGRPVVLTAPTGSGKSTCVPRWLATEGRRVLVVEPRRVACRSLARWVAAQEGTALGEEVGYTVRHDERRSDRTRIEYATTGVVLRRYASQGGFGDANVVILDELHERSMEIDLLLGLLKQDKRVARLVMSATLDGPRVAGWLGGELLEAGGRVHPVDVRHMGEETLPSARELPERVRDAVRGGLKHEGDLLVFLPGKSEIARCEGALSGLDVDVLPLHASLPPERQDRVFETGARRRRVVLATNVAETAVTLPRIGVVIDSGLVRRTHYRDGHGVLALAPIAMDSAEQRRGRAGRLMAGHCIRLWSALGRLDPSTPPELLREGLEKAVFAAASCGQRLADMDLLDAPPDYAVERAEETLRALGALDDEGRLTTVGGEMGRLPLDPAHARLLVAAGEDREVLQDAVDLVAALGGGRRLLRSGAPGAAEAHRALSGDPPSDVSALINAVRCGRPESDALSGPTLAEARKTARQIRELLGLPAVADGTPLRERGLAEAVARSVPRSVFVPRRKGQGWTCGGLEVRLPRESLVEPDSEAIVVVALHHAEGRTGRRTEVTAAAAMPCRLSWLRAAGVGKAEADRSEVRGGVLVSTMARRIAHVTVAEREETPTGDVARREAARLFAEGRLGKRFKETRKEAAARLEARTLWARLQGEESGPSELESFARERLTELGFESGDDLPLIESDDLLPEALPEEAARTLAERYPRELKFGGLRCVVEYDTKTRTVTLVAQGARQATPPSLQFLPAWSGWKIKFRVKNAVRVLRG